MATWLIVNGDMYDSQRVVKGDTMEDVELHNDLKWATLIVRLDEETIKAIKDLENDAE